jgi:hypothetical protein
MEILNVKNVRILAYATGIDYLCSGDVVKGYPHELMIIHMQ